VRLDDPEVVRREYASEAGLAVPKSVYAFADGPNAHDLVLAAVAEVAPRRVLDVGCGEGEIAERIVGELGCEVVAVDQSERLVELARARGIDARVGDVEALSFADGSFGCATANWMLFHVADLDRALAELARVLRPGGRLVAATNSLRHLGELWALVGRDRTEPVRFSSETGEQPLREHFPWVERRDVEGRVTFPTREDVRAFIASSIAHEHLAERVPPLDRPLVATRRAAIFVAEKA
jgi:SAM-dependent methyltransferase